MPRGRELVEKRYEVRPEKKARPYPAGMVWGLRIWISSKISGIDVDDVAAACPWDHWL